MKKPNCLTFFWYHATASWRLSIPRAPSMWPVTSDLSPHKRGLDWSGLGGWLLPHVKTVTPPPRTLGHHFWWAEKQQVQTCNWLFHKYFFFYLQQEQTLVKRKWTESKWNPQVTGNNRWRHQLWHWRHQIVIKTLFITPQCDKDTSDGTRWYRHQPWPHNVISKYPSLYHKAMETQAMTPKCDVDTRHYTTMWWCFHILV